MFDADGHEVLITLMCLKCRQVKPLAQFGLRKMPDGAIRNQPWCRGCRGAATPKKRPDAVDPAPAETASPASPPGPEVEDMRPRRSCRSPAASADPRLPGRPPPWLEAEPPGVTHLSTHRVDWFTGSALG